MKFNEAIEKLIENPKDVYQCSPGKRFELSVSEMGYFRLKAFDGDKELDPKTGVGGFSGNITVDTNWELKREPVSFMEAFEAWRKGKTITVERSNPIAWPTPTVGTYQKDQGNCDNPWWYANDLIYGKWFIQD